MAKRKLLNRLIHKTDIKEKMKLIKGSETDYITPTGKIYKDYGNEMFLPKKLTKNKNNGYLYCGISYKRGQVQRRVHILVAEAYIPNPNKLPIVMHLDNNKENCYMKNLKWGTISENTRQSYNDGLHINAKSWEDSQSHPVICINRKTGNIEFFGSVSEASLKTGMTKSGIIYQCKNKIKRKPRKKYIFKYLIKKS